MQAELQSCRCGPDPEHNAPHPKAVINRGFSTGCILVLAVYYAVFLGIKGKNRDPSIK